MTMRDAPLIKEENPSKVEVTFGPFRLSAAERLIERSGEPLQLGGRAMDILIALVERAGEVVSQRELINRVWSNVTGDDGNLRFHVGALRRALGDGRDGARYVVNVPGARLLFRRFYRATAGRRVCAGPDRPDRCGSLPPFAAHAHGGAPNGG
jgi:DNA-binding response OmpR family regulator